MMTNLYLHVVLVALSLSGALKISLVETNSDQPTKVVAARFTDLAPNYNPSSTANNAHNALDAMLYSMNPANTKCTNLQNDTSDHLKDYEYLFSKGFGKTFLLEGDSLMQ